MLSTTEPSGKTILSMYILYIHNPLCPKVAHKDRSHQHPYQSQLKVKRLCLISQSGMRFDCFFLESTANPLLVYDRIFKKSLL